LRAIRPRQKHQEQTETRSHNDSSRHGSPFSPSGTTPIPKRFPMRGFDWFDTDVRECGRVKDPDEKITARNPSHLWHAFFRLCIIPTFQENLAISCALTKTHLPAKRENPS
jgi:hypothetical protein